jgi:hypothetical protein
MSSLCLLHASASEYIILFGSPLPTSGHSGRYPIEVHDFVLTGEYKNQLEGTTVAETHKPGDRVYLPSMKTCFFCVPNEVWMLEYGRGFLPFSLAFQAADSVFRFVFKRIQFNV